eukprot:COSAG05_NODE_2597_length_2860_cov_2.626222_1_plen_67_part_00
MSPLKKEKAYAVHFTSVRLYEDGLNSLLLCSTKLSNQFCFQNLYSYTDIHSFTICDIRVGLVPDRE